MLFELTVNLPDLIAIIVAYTSLLIWVNHKLKRIERLERVVFDENGQQRYANVYVYKDVMEKLNEISDAIILMNHAQMIQIDVQIEYCENSTVRHKLEAVRDELNKKRGIVK